MANTLAGLGALGLRTGFVGRVNDDALGHFYADTMIKGGTDFLNDIDTPYGNIDTIE